MFPRSFSILLQGAVATVRYLPQHSNYCSSSGIIQISKIRQITCIGLNRPESKNRLSIALMTRLKEAIDNFEKDETSPVAVLYGERGNFSYGHDIDEVNNNPKYFSEIEKIDLLDTFTSKPIVAGISGFAVGLAFDIALWCDFRVVEETAVLGGYARKFGAPACDTVARRLYNAVGLNKALDLMLTGRVVKAKEALDCGIANRVVACGAGLGQAVSFAQSLANMPQACMRSDRATLLSISKKYSEERRGAILELKSSQRKTALEEAESRMYVTKNEDVRKRGN